MKKAQCAIAAFEERPLRFLLRLFHVILPQYRAAKAAETAFSRKQGSEEIARPKPSLMTFDNDDNITNVHTYRVSNKNRPLKYSISYLS